MNSLGHATKKLVQVSSFSMVPVTKGNVEDTLSGIENYKTVNKNI